jgi:hypothetical protein
MGFKRVIGSEINEIVVAAFIPEISKSIKLIMYSECIANALLCSLHLRSRLCQQEGRIRI